MMTTITFGIEMYLLGILAAVQTRMAYRLTINREMAKAEEQAAEQEAEQCPA